MKFKIDWSETSTKRGAVWIIGAAISMVFYWFGKDPLPVITVTASVAGGLGVALKDKS